MRYRWLYVTNLLQQDRVDIPYLEYNEDWSLEQEILTSRAAGIHGEYDILGTSPSPVLPRDIMISALVDGNTGAEVEQKMKDLVRRTVGPVRMLWRGYPDESDLKWTLVRLANLSFGRERLHTLIHPVEITFRQLDPFLYKGLDSSWLSSSGYTVATLDPNIFPDRLFGFNYVAKFVPSSSPYTFNIENIGDFTSRRLIFYIKVTGANGAENLKISNITTSQFFQYSITGTTSSHEFVVNCNPGVMRGLISTDSGTTWNYLDPSIGPLQAVFMELAPGVNELQLTVSGIPSLEIYVWWQHAYLW